MSLTELETVKNELNQAREALLFVLPYVHVDIRAQALAIYSIPQTPLEDHIGSLGAVQPSGDV